MTNVTNTPTSINTIMPIKGPGTQTHEQDMKLASKELGEQIVVTMLRELIPIPQDTSYTPSHATQTFQELLRDEYAKKVAQQNDFGISKKIESSFNQITSGE